MVYAGCALIVLLLVGFSLALQRAFVAPLPQGVEAHFVLTPDSEGELEAAVRGYRYLKRNRLLSGRFCIVLCHPSKLGRKMAERYADSEDIFITEEIGL